jgi:hypothetical protein
MVHVLRCNKVRRIGGANAENTTAPGAPPRTMACFAPGRRRHHVDNRKGAGSTSGASRGAASGTVRPIRWMRGNRGAW